jgi:hypothetical protein
MPLIYLSYYSSCFLEPKPLSWLSYSPPPSTLSCKHLLLTSLLQHCYNMSLHLHSNLCPYFGFSYFLLFTQGSSLYTKKGGPINLLQNSIEIYPLLIYSNCESSCEKNNYNICSLDFINHVREINNLFSSLLFLIFLCSMIFSTTSLSMVLSQNI